jgi:hypothetical protein
MTMKRQAGRPVLQASTPPRCSFLEKTGRIARTKGVNVALHRLTKDDPRLSVDMRAFPGRTWLIKAIADYETRPGSEVSLKMALNAVTDGAVFVALMIELIGESRGSQPPP